MTDTSQAVAALAEAIAAVTKRRGGHGNPACYMQSAEDALQAIRADPELAGFKTMTVSAWEDANDSAFNGRSELPQPPYLIVPDPQPPEPTLPTGDEIIRDLWSCFYELPDSKKMREADAYNRIDKAIREKVYRLAEAATQAPRP